jgi:hypothetical protein
VNITRRKGTSTRKRQLSTENEVVAPKKVAKKQYRKKICSADG